MPAAIAQEIQSPIRLGDVTTAPSTTSDLKSSHFTTLASGLMPVEVTAQTSKPTIASPVTVMGASEIQTAQFTLSSTPLNLSGLELAQVTPAANGVSGPPVPSYPALTAPAGSQAPATPLPTEQPPATEPPQPTPPANKWHFLFQSYIYAPLSISGDVTVRGFEADLDTGPSQIYSNFFDTFRFGFLGRVEGWAPDYRWGFLLNGEYLALRKENSFTRPDPNRFLDLAINRVANRIQARVDDVLRQQIADYLAGRLDGRIQAELEARLGAKLDTIIPSSFQSDTKVETWSIDLAGAYRFYNQSQANPRGVATEFDLGPYLVDLIAGIRIAGVTGELDVTTNLGSEGEFSRSVTTVKPLLGTRFRYNFSPYFAGVIAGSVAGFNIGSLGLNWEAMGGFDWMFSGNTSIGLGYRFAYTGYNSNGLDVSAYSNGPYATLTFRF